MSLPSGATDTILEGRLQTTDPYVDAYAFVGAGRLSVDDANLALTRNAVGNWSLNRTAGGAETYNVAAQFGLFDRVVALEKWDVGTQTFAPIDQSGTAVLKGIKLLDVIVNYTVGVAALTSAVLVLKKTAYVDNTAPAVTDLPLTVSFTSKLAARTGPYQVKGTVTTPAFVNTDNTLLIAEAQFVMANTGTLKVNGFVFHFQYLF